MSELIYGRQAVRETLRAGRRRIYRIWLEEKESHTPAGAVLGEIQATAEQMGIPRRSIRGGIFEKLARQQCNAQGVALEVDSYPYVDLTTCLTCAAASGESPLLLLLDQLQDPQNLGTLIRTAEAMGTHGIVIPERRAAQITPAVCNVTAGAVEHMAVAQVTNLSRTIETLQRENVWVVGLDAQPEVQPLAQADLGGALAVVVGSEGRGLSRLVREKCDFLVRIPMFGLVESLNAAVAGSIVLYTARQARSA